MSATTPPWQPPPAAPVVPLSKPLGGSFSFLAVAVQLSLLLGLGIAGYTLMTSLEGLALIDDLEAGTGTTVEANDFDARTRALVITSGAFYLLTAGLFISWMYTLRTSAAAAAEALRHGAGWAIGGWFVPFLNFVRPYQIMVDLWRAMVRPARPFGIAAQPPVPRLVPLWWASFLVMSIGGRLGAATVANLPDSLDSARQALQLEIALDISGVIAAVLAVGVVRTYTARALITPPPTTWTPLPNAWPSAAQLYPEIPSQLEARFPYGRPPANGSGPAPRQH